MYDVVIVITNVETDDEGQPYTTSNVRRLDIEEGMIAQWLACAENGPGVVAAERLGAK